MSIATAGQCSGCRWVTRHLDLSPLQEQWMMFLCTANTVCKSGGRAAAQHNRARSAGRRWGGSWG